MIVYKNPWGNLRTPTKVLNGDPKYNLSWITSISDIPDTFPSVECQLDNIMPFSLVFNRVSRGVTNNFRKPIDSKCPIWNNY